jgi:uncharacterized protein
MALSMYQGSVPVFLQLLGGLNGFLDKAQQQAAARKLDGTVLINWRLYPDMFTLARQVKAASDHAINGAGRVAGAELPKLPDADASIDEMKARVSKTIDFLKTLKPAQLDGAEDREVTITMGGQPRTFKGQNYLYHMAMPNFYFHVTTAYNILRHLGFDIGKRDFMGQMPS